VPHKKRVLLRWQESGIDGSTIHELPPSSSDKVLTPPTISGSQATPDLRKSSLASTVSSSEAQDDKAQDSTVGSGYNNPDFFDDLSDNEEFELVGTEKHGLDRNSEGVEESGDVEGVGGEGQITREGPRTPPAEEEVVEPVSRPALLEKQNSSLSSISDASFQSSEGGMEGEDGAVTPPPTPPPPAASTPAANLSDISSDMDQSAARSETSIGEAKQPQSDAEMEGFPSTTSGHEIVTLLAKEQGETQTALGTRISESPHSPLSQEGSNLETEEKQLPGEMLALGEAIGREKGSSDRVDEESGEATGSPEKMTSGPSKTPGKRKVDGLPKVLLRMDNQTMTHDLHAGSISPLHPEMSSSGYFMERNRTLGKQNSSVSSNCSV